MIGSLWPLEPTGLRAPPLRRHLDADDHARAALRDPVLVAALRRGQRRELERQLVLDGLAYPTAPRARLAAVGRFHHWWWLLERHVASRRASQARDEVGRCWAAFEGRARWDPSPLDELGRATGQGLRALASPAQWERLAANVHASLFEGLAAARRADAVPSPEAYRLLRRRASGFDVVPTLVELADHDELGPSELADPRIAELHALVAEHAVGVDDLASYYREVVTRGRRLHFVPSLLAHGVASAPAALDQLALELDMKLARFEALAVSLGWGTARHVAALRWFIAGHHRFVFHSGRYQHPDAPLEVLRLPPSEVPPGRDAIW